MAGKRLSGLMLEMRVFDSLEALWTSSRRYQILLTGRKKDIRIIYHLLDLDSCDYLWTAVQLPLGQAVGLCTSWSHSGQSDYRSSKPICYSGSVRTVHLSVHGRMLSCINFKVNLYYIESAESWYQPSLAPAEAGNSLGLHSHCSIFLSAL